MHYIITVFFDYHEFEQEITRKNRGNRLKNLEFSFSPEKKTYLYSKNCGKINIGEKYDRKRL